MFGTAYSPNVWGSGPHYAHGSYDCHDDRNKLPYRQLPYPVYKPANDLFRFYNYNINCETFPHWTDPRYQALIKKDLKIIRWLGNDFIRVHILTATTEHLNFLKWFGKVVHEHGLKLYIDLLSESPNGLPLWDQSNPELCGKFVKEVGHLVDYWQVINEQEKNPKAIDIIEQCYKEMSKYNKDVKLATNAVWFPLDYFTELCGKVPVKVVGADYYPLGEKEKDLAFLNDELKKIKTFKQKYPDVDVWIAEFGIHPSAESPIKYTTSGLRQIAEAFNWGARALLGSMQIDGFIQFWYDDLFIYRSKCYHQSVNLDRSITDLGACWKQIIKEYKGEPHYDVAAEETVLRGKTTLFKLQVKNNQTVASEGLIELLPPEGASLDNYQQLFKLRPGQSQEFSILMNDDGLPSGTNHLLVKIAASEETYFYPVLFRKSGLVNFIKDESAINITGNIDEVQAFFNQIENTQSPGIIIGTNSSREINAAAMLIKQTIPLAWAKTPVLLTVDELNKHKELDWLILIDTENNNIVKQLICDQTGKGPQYKITTYNQVPCLIITGKNDEKVVQGCIELVYRYYQQENKLTPHFRG